MAPRGRGRKSSQIARGVPLSPVLRLSKQEVAQREIDAAIGLFLSGGDPVVVYLLAMAALHVVEGVARHKGIVTMFEMHVLSWPAEARAEYRDILNGPYNFMKHGGSDTALVEDFMPSMVHLHLVVAFSSYEQVFGEETPGVRAMKAWLATNEPSLVP